MMVTNYSPEVASDLIDRAARFGSISVRNRLIMAPLTRTRAHEDGTASNMMVEYYRQRAGAGMIVSEGIYPVLQGKSYLGQPGIETDAHVESWRRVTDAVHAEGGSIVAQLMHSGRISHAEISGRPVVGASSVRAPGDVRTPAGKQPHPVPETLEIDDIAHVVDGYVRAAENSLRAGFDGVELHAANGYLLHQFLSPNTNRRNDAYGGGKKERRQLVLETVTKVTERIGVDRVGIRLSPANNIHGIEENMDRDAETYLELATELRSLGIAYVSLVYEDPYARFVRAFRSRIDSPFIVNTGPSIPTTREEALSILEAEWIDGVVVGRAYIANPDLPRRWREGARVNEPEETTFYVGGPRGYTDYS